MKKYTKAKYEHANVSSVDQQMIEAFNHLDSRISPKTDSFNILSGQSVHKFFSDLESYCNSKFNCDQGGFVPELGRNLTGEAHNVYYAVRGPNDSYRDSHLCSHPRQFPQLSRWNQDTGKASTAVHASLR